MSFHTNCFHVYHFLFYKHGLWTQRFPVYRLVTTIYFVCCRTKMSVYDRAVRPSFKSIGSTGLHVGPGAYDVELTDKSKIRSGIYVIYSTHSVIGLAC